MPDFVADLTPLPFPKTDLKPLSGTADPTKAITAAAAVHRPARFGRRPASQR